MAGGRGTRISEFTNSIPKPMIRIGGKPILEHQIEVLKMQGFTDIIITIGYLSNAIIEYFGDGNRISPITGKNFGVNIEYYIEKEQLGNAGALFYIKDKLKEDFLLINGDIIFNIDFNRFLDYHKQKEGLITLFTHPNSHPYDSALIVANEDGSVEKWLSKEEERKEFYKNRVNAGIHILSSKVLDRKIVTQKIDLDRQILKPFAGTGKMYIYDSPEYVRDMGTLERYKEVCKDYDKGIVEARSLANRQKAIFLDRDGTINEYVGFLKSIEELKLIPGVTQAIKKMHEAGYLVIVVTNQPVIARGEVSIDELSQIHNKIETLLGMEGTYLDDIYYCPHHPHKGYAGERKEYKINCKCRKPKAGMLIEAAKRYNIDLSKSWMVGDGENDILAGKNAGCNTALITLDKKYYGQTKTVKSLKDFVNKVLES